MAVPVARAQGRTLPAGFARHAVPAVLTLAALALGLVRLGTRSLWLDEAFTIGVTGGSTADFLGQVDANGGSMLLYYAFMHGWLRLGLDEWVVRLPSLLFAAASVPLLFALVTRLRDRRTAAIATTLVVVSAPFVQYSQEARSYSLFLLLVVGSWLLLLRAVERGDRRSWVLYGACATASVYAHFFGLLFVGTQLLSLALLPRGAVPFGRALRTATTIGALASPLVAIAVLADSGAPTWIDPLNETQVFRLLTLLSRDTVPRATAVYLVVALLAAVPIVRAALRRGRHRTTFDDLVPLVWVAVPVLAALAVSATAQPLLEPRYLLPAVPAVAILVASALARTPLPVALLAVGILVAATVPRLELRYDLPAEDWVATTHHVLDAAEPGDAIALYGGSRTPFEYYVDRLGAHGIAPTAIQPPGRWGDVRRVYASASDPALAVHLDEVARVWVVERLGVSAPEALLQQLRASGFLLVDDAEFQGPVRVKLFDRTGPSS